MSILHLFQNGVPYWIIFILVKIVIFGHMKSENIYLKIIPNNKFLKFAKIQKWQEKPEKWYGKKSNPTSIVQLKNARQTVFKNRSDECFFRLSFKSTPLIGHINISCIYLIPNILQANIKSISYNQCWLFFKRLQVGNYLATTKPLFIC